MIHVTPMEQIGLDERGGTYVFDTSGRSGPFMMTHRRAGSVSGRHFHQGIHPGKNPERLVLMKGDILLNWKHVGGDAHGSQPVHGPALIVIPAGVWHEVIAVTDFVMMELNSTADGKGDTYWMLPEELG
ncbi:hypothetical protein [Dinghuibacter silviterrae]|uniref:Uncharacterized protein n=1 Tax=Dinghuibacter silviterrae TaxID=1539049 RepID=A0A4R8DJE1_9BACT|nr:hypothetical protein [Dinghuibacter silviterrae]TDW97306.1 hypothetical protein EDB95_5153 [Dinghuibacter silviterrae]